MNSINKLVFKDVLVIILSTILLSQIAFIVYNLVTEWDYIVSNTIDSVTPTLFGQLFGIGLSIILTMTVLLVDTVYRKYIGLLTIVNLYLIIYLGVTFLGTIELYNIVISCVIGVVSTVDLYNSRRLTILSRYRSILIRLNDADTFNASLTIADFRYLAHYLDRCLNRRTTIHSGLTMIVLFRNLDSDPQHSTEESREMTREMDDRFIEYTRLNDDNEKEITQVSNALTYIMQNK